MSEEMAVSVNATAEESLGEDVWWSIELGDVKSEEEESAEQPSQAVETPPAEKPPQTKDSKLLQVKEEPQPTLTEELLFEPDKDKINDIQTDTIKTEVEETETGVQTNENVERGIKRTALDAFSDDGNVEFFIENNQVLGSESEESEGSDEEIGRELQVPRSFRLFISDTEDTPLERQAAEVTVDITGVVSGPTSLHDFEWEPLPANPIDPMMRRDAFVYPCGPKIARTTSPYDAFVKIWDRPIMELIAQQTNEYASRALERGLVGSNHTKWTDTTPDELYVFFALLVAMGIVIKTRIRDYWSGLNDIFTTPGFNVAMSLQRFLMLARCLHFNTNSNLSKVFNSSQAKLQKIKPIVDHLNSKFCDLYRLGQNIVLDESLTKWKGWLDIEVPNKAATVGVKTYELCDSRTGYLWYFEVHAGGEAQAEQELIPGAIPNLVLRLLRGLEYRGHTVWMDNYYNSPALARLLKTMGFDCAGTLRTNRQFVPEKIRSLMQADMRIGQVSGCTSGDVDLMVWQDKNRVAMISTYHGQSMYDNKPILIRDYNVCLDGLDRKDQMLAMYPMERKRTRVWYKKFFRRLLNVSILNAYILHKHDKITPIEHRNFRMALVIELLEKHRQLPEVSMSPTRPHKFTPEAAQHMPVARPTLRGGEKHGKQRRKCVICSKRIHTWCRACNVSACYSFSNPINCFVKYHTK